MFFHQLIDFLRKLSRRAMRVISPEETEYRSNRHFRIAHWLVLISFPVLALTGFALKFPEAWWARPFISWNGHFDLRGSIHRAAAVVLMAALGYHAVHLFVDKRARHILSGMARAFAIFTICRIWSATTWDFPRRVPRWVNSITGRRSNTWPSCGGSLSWR
ncbi:MAG TPA: cytochrome b/b6 domain-containing protein [Candidatus Acidoferrales bacterium]|nr:cytochrome b/b6 domain-containing protein [Candidatus Acidoferrales bacterium]